MSKVSVIILYFERSELLKQALRSVASQRYENWEVIVVDDGSGESEWDAVQSLASDRIQVLRRNNGPKGPSRCRNQGVAAATGDYLLFLDSDDLLADYCLERRLNQVGSEPDSDLWVFPVEVFCDRVGDLKTPWNQLDPGGD